MDLREGQLTPCANCNGPCSYEEKHNDVVCSENTECKYFDTRRTATIFATEKDAVDLWNARFIDRWSDGWMNEAIPLEAKI